MRKKELQKIALERIKHLFKEAEKVFPENPERANRYVQIARRIAMKVNLRIPRELKRRFCKHCYSFLVPGVNCRVRTYRHRVIYYCYNCGKYMRFPLKQKKIKTINN